MKKIFTIATILHLVITTAVAQVEEVSPTTFLMDVDGHELKLPYYFTKPLDQLDESITQLVISQHGNNRNATTYRLSMLTAAVEAGKSEQTLIIAPQFLTREDIEEWNLPNDYLFWYNSGWKIGDRSRTNVASLPRPAQISSFEAMDQLIMHVLASGNFPNIKDIVVAGFSAGGQFVNRYAAANLLHNDVKQTYEIDIRYLAGGPSSFLYMNNERRVVGTTDQFAVPATGCSEYNDYKYGLNSRNNYLNKTTETIIREQYATRKILYLVGDQDNNPNASALDKDCPAMLQGEQRLERSVIYFNYLKHYYGAEIEDLQQFSIVPDVGHDHNAIFRSTIGSTWIFKNDITTSVNKLDTQLKQVIYVYPNPVIANAKLNYYLPNAELVTLKITNLSGTIVQEFAQNYQQPGNHQVVWQAQALPKGIYFAVLQTGNKISTTKIIHQ